MISKSLVAFTVAFMTLGGPALAKCANYATQAEAQAAFDANPRGLSKLDRNNNGIPCENLPAGYKRSSTSIDFPTQKLISPSNNRFKRSAGRYYFTRWPHRVEERRSMSLEN